MGCKGGLAGALVVSMVLAVFAAGCGGSSSDANEPVRNEGESASSTSEPAGNASFLKPKGENKIATFGEEASEEEREAASEALEENLEAREAGDWETQCASLGPNGIKEVEEGAEVQGVGGGGCAKELKARAEPLSQTKSLRENSMTGPIDVLRVEGDRGYAIYHGTEGQDYSMPMEKVDGEWKVASLLESGL